MSVFKNKHIKGFTAGFTKTSNEEAIRASRDTLQTSKYLQEVRTKEKIQQSTKKNTKKAITPTDFSVRKLERPTLSPENWVSKLSRVR